MAVSLDLSEMSKLDRIISRGKPMRKGQLLSTQGENFISVFALKTGSVKTYTTSAEGDEQITGFAPCTTRRGVEGHVIVGVSEV